MGHRDVDDSLLGELLDVLVNLRLLVAEVEAAFDAVDERDRAVLDAGVQLGAVGDEPDAGGVVGRDLLLDGLEIVQQRVEVAVLGR